MKPTPRRRNLCAGYYAMPLPWTDKIIGWANASAQSKSLSVEIGFAGNKPADTGFPAELEQEIERLKIFLNFNE